MLKKITCLVIGIMIVGALSGCGKENKTQTLANKELIRDADYSEGNVVVPYINIDSSEVDEINNFLRDKAEELRSYEFEEIDGKKSFIHSTHYTYYLDEQILSILFVEHSSEGDGYDWHYSYNIDLENNKVLTTEHIVSKLMNDERSKELDKKVLDELDKKMADGEFNKSYVDNIVREYIIAFQSFNVSTYIKEENKITFIIPIELPSYQDNLMIDIEFELSDLFKETNNKDINKDIKTLKGKVLDFSISDYYQKLTDVPDYVTDLASEYDILMEKERHADIFPEEIKSLYGTYLPYSPIENLIGGWIATYVATSTLEDGKYDYNVNNLANELDKNVSWVEGKEGYGIGEKIIINMIQSNEFCEGNMIEGYREIIGDHIKEDYNTSFNGIYIVNGYAENEKLYKANSRVKKLKLTIDDKIEYILELEDTMKPQIFDINYKINHAERLYPIKAEFEILEVYKGEKYEDTAINTLRVGFDSNVMKGGR